MNTYSWPASIAIVDGEFILTFSDWPDIAVSGTSVQELILSATDKLSSAVLAQIRAGGAIPQPSDLGPRQTPIAIDAETAAHLDSYLEERQIRIFRQNNEVLEFYRNRRAAFLAEHRASIDPIERLIERMDAAARDFASIGIRFCYILNAGGLVVIPAIMEILPDAKIEGSLLLWPAGSFGLGVLLAAVTNYLAYISTTKASEAWSYESNARAKECSAAYYPPENQATHQGEIEAERASFKIKLGRAQFYANIGICTFVGTIFAFLAGVGLAICGLW